MPSPVSRYRLPLAAAAMLVLAACNPTFNWREVPIADAGLVALLPCKPDRANRALPLGAESVQVDMAGCETGGATFAVAHASAANPAQAEAWLAAWRAAMRNQLSPAQLTEGSAALQRATAVPAPVRLDAQPAHPGSASVQVLWFAQSQKDGRVALYQATVLGRPSSPEAAKTFFEGLRLP
ncbi:hypothetical protein ASC78_16885 [Variovorax sp. Root318D1]|uniref:hypothetical protein n=1 Tax=Variovorax sp. Root318D1 TaxID=1736513 RepID=UPI0007015294|nr:hypothetical protein [Variovorax sp. Root318D1]KQU82276.1 hypothetical protein ASC78_16885 [Variovorax sp. Root318D1]